MRWLLVLGFAVVTIFGPAAPSPAFAGTPSFTDRGKDVPHSMDTQRVTVRNTSSRLIVTLKHGAVNERGGKWSGVYIDVSPQSHGAVPDYYIAGGVGTDYQYFLMNGWQVRNQIRCDFKESINFAEDTTTFSRPRSCLNGASFEAKAVRFSAIAGACAQAERLGAGERRFSPWIRRG